MIERLNVILSLILMFSELIRSTTVKRLLCGKGFEKMIEDASDLGFKDLENHIEEIKLNDLEVISKFKQLGLMEDNITKEMKKTGRPRACTRFYKNCKIF